MATECSYSASGESDKSSEWTDYDESDGDSFSDVPTTDLTIGICSLWKEEQLLDYTIHVDNHDFRVHKVVLASVSSHSRNQMMKDQDHIEIIEGISAVAVKNLVEFMYTNTMNITKDNVAEILDGAKYFEMQSAIDSCTKFFATDQGSCSPTTDDPLIAGVQSLRQNGQLLDYKIQVEDQEFQVHKIILASRSDYFQAMLTGGMTESDSDSVKIKEVSTETVETLINYIYSNDLAITKQTVAEILGGAVYFQIKSAIKVCEKFMLDNLTSKNWLSFLALLKSYGLMASVKSVRRYVIRNMMCLIKTCDCGQLPLEELRFIIDNWQGNEHHLFLFITKWVAFDVEKRKGHQYDLLSLVRYGLISPLVLAEIKQLGYYSKESPDAWCQLVDAAIEYHKLPLHQRVLDSSMQTKVRADPTFMTFPSWGSDEAGSYYDKHERAFYEQFNSPKGFNVTFSGIEINNFLIVLLELEGGKREDWPWYIFDPRTLQWAQIASVPLDLSAISLTHDGKYLYAPGGQTDDDKIIDRIDRYDFKTNTWTPFSRLAVPTKEHATCVLNNGLYTSGGFKEDFRPGWCAVEDYDTKCLSIMHCLDLSTLKWGKKAPMPQKCYDHCMYPMKILGEEVLVLINNNFDLLYYSPSNDQWLTCSFTFNKPSPLRQCREIVRGNRVYLTDLDLRARAKQNTFDRKSNKNQHTCAVVTFSEHCKEAAVDYWYKHDGGFICLVRFTVLSFCPDTYQDPPYKGGERGSGEPKGH